MPQEKILPLHIILIILIGLVVYANSLNNGFVWDDYSLVVDNAYIRDVSSLPKAFTECIGAGYRRSYPGQAWAFYRPLQTSTYMLNYYISGLKPFTYHLTNILLHILVALGLYWFVGLLSKDRLLALLAALFFVIHPIHTEAVDYVSGRADSLALLFMLLAFIFYIKQANLKNYLILLPAYALALASKENSLILLPLLLLYHYVYRVRLRRKAFLSLFGLACIYIFLRVFILKNIFAHTGQIAFSLEAVPRFCVALTNYLRLLLLPFDLHMWYGKASMYPVGFKAVLGALILSLLLFYALKKRRDDKILSFCIFWFFLTLLPVSGIFHPLPFYMAEHYLYVPSVAFFILLSRFLIFLYRRWPRRILATALIAAILISYSCSTIRQNRIWRDPVTFYRNILKHEPDNYIICEKLASEYSSRGEIRPALETFKKAISLNPGYINSYLGLAILSTRIGKGQEALGLCLTAIEADPNSAEAYNTLGYIYYHLGMRKEAIAAFEKAIALDSAYTNPRHNLGLIKSSPGRD
ncbi:MAG: tetratricopeptide repeat protein [Candidatus Omnitrophica bacterium]|nr:tetratricopeptide repeat protein [Candidatus Omnitrophota bacterium]